MAIVTNPLMSDHQTCARRMTGVWLPAFLFLAIFRIVGTPNKRSQCKRYEDVFGKKNCPKWPHHEFMRFFFEIGHI
jgi:hypothetical protein